MSIEQMSEPVPDTFITTWDVSIFTQGECWYLAWVLHRKTGWPVVLLRPSTNRYDDDFDHVLVRIPDGRLLDVYGAQSDAEVLTRWVPCGDLDQISDLDAARIVGSSLLLHPLHEEAEHLADLLLGELNGQPVNRLHA